jgi:hypothetical protein
MVSRGFHQGIEMSQMRRLIVTLTVAGLVSGCAHAELVRRQHSRETPSSKPSPWAAVQALPPGRSVSVQLSTGWVINGRVIAVDEKRLALSSSVTKVSLTREEIHRVAVFGNRPLGRHIGRGLLIGAVAVGTLNAVASRGNLQWTLRAAVGGALWGAVIGAFTGIHAYEDVIYDVAAVCREGS